ncbi:hypothetical protein EYF80_044812 [Liparis tanakae]|uniref:Uncharacterized protein n=1 Tax=Liparis tanakae TaxID=230148 RepID=A0A4Z2FUR2_9TELE|nr:hypothetical protein EYF80_044812 [Liparis tanakae]
MERSARLEGGALRAEEERLTEMQRRRSHVAARGAELVVWLQLLLETLLHPETQQVPQGHSRDLTGPTRSQQRPNRSHKVTETQQVLQGHSRDLNTSYKVTETQTRPTRQPPPLQVLPIARPGLSRLNTNIVLRERTLGSVHSLPCLSVGVKLHAARRPLARPPGTTHAAHIGSSPDEHERI